MSTTKKKKKPAYTEAHRESTHKARAEKHGKQEKHARPEKHEKREKHEKHEKQAERRTGAVRKHLSKVVRDVMTPRVVAVTSVTFLPEAARIMKEEDVGALPVVQEDGKLLGIVTDRDITVRAVAAGLDIASTRIADVYTAEDILTVTPETALDEAEEVMAEHQVRRLPIIGAGDKLVGMVSLADIAREIGQLDAAEVLRDVSKQGGEHSQVNEDLL